MEFSCCDLDAEVDIEAAMAAIRSRRSSVAELVAVIEPGGLSCARWLVAVPAAVGLLPSLDKSDRVELLHLLWRLTVDTRIDRTLTVKTMTAPSASAPDGCCNSAANARFARGLLAPLLPKVRTLLDGAAEEAAAAAALLSAQVESADTVGPWLVEAAVATLGDPARARALVLAAAALAGTMASGQEVLRPLFEMAMAERADPEVRRAAAIGMRNVTWPQPPSTVVVESLTCPLRDAGPDLRPWTSANNEVRVHGTLLIDWPQPHLALVRAAVRSADAEVRHSGVAEAWRGACARRSVAAKVANVLGGLVGDRDGDVAELATKRLALMGNAAAAVSDRLYEAFVEPGQDRAVRAYGLLALGRLGDERVLGALVDEVTAPALIADVGPALDGLRRFADVLVPAIAGFLSGAIARRISARAVSLLDVVAGWPDMAAVWVPSVVGLVDDEVAGADALAALAGLPDPPDMVVDAALRRISATNAARVRARAAAILARSRREADRGWGVLREMLDGGTTEQFEAMQVVSDLGVDAEPVAQAIEAVAQSVEPRMATLGARTATLAACVLNDMGHVEYERQLEQALRARLARRPVLTTLSRTGAQVVGLRTLLTEIAVTDIRVTWPAIHDSAVISDERYCGLAKAALSRPRRRGRS